MSRYSDSCESGSCFVSRAEERLKAHPCSNGRVGVSRTPAVVDVMGGIGEDSGALVLTATAGHSFHAAVWNTDDDHVRLSSTRRAAEQADRHFALPTSAFSGTDPAAEVIDRCREANAEWATPAFLALIHAEADGIVPKAAGGLCFVVHTDFLPEADLGRLSAEIAAVVDALCKLFDADADRLAQSRVCAKAISQLNGLYYLRRAMTALCGPANGALLQLRFHPHLFCETLELPTGIIVKAVSTRLSRPTLLNRLLETRTCSEMGHRLIMDLQRQDGMQFDPGTSRLSSITPAEFVERYRDRMPSKITHEAFVSQFGTLRGLEDGGINPKGIYKIRSRAEHHIYENRRVHEFATHMVRARRSDSTEPIEAAGELMYASHWSHSQRCGIGGVETDRLVNLLRSRGPAAGLFGAKVTAGGEGGELVVLMRSDEQAHAALAEAVAEAEAASQTAIHVFEGSLPGADAFEAPNLTSLLDSAEPV